MPHVNRSPRFAHQWRPHDLDEETEPPPVPRGADLVDPTDPAFGHICYAAIRLAKFGFDPSDPDMARRAIEVGRKDYEEDPLTKEAARVHWLTRKRIKGPMEIADGEVVYYMRIGNRVKIGWTTNLAKRTSTINPEEVMVTEPGNRVLEQERHKQFADLNTHGEWFRLEAPLKAHIRELRALAKKVDVPPSQ